MHTKKEKKKTVTHIRILNDFIYILGENLRTGYEGVERYEIL